MGQIVTFYSFKGGVGRSMALANVAVLLNRWGYKTLIIDWDLEAPGLELYFQKHVNLEEVTQRKGIVDLLTDGWSSEIEPPDTIPWKEMLTGIKLHEGQILLHLISAGKGAGKREQAYLDKLRSLSLEEFYENGGGNFIEELRNQWKTEYDFVLIDSRTGVTDIGSVCTVQLPDILVLLFTANAGSFYGAVDMHSKIKLGRQRLPVDRLSLLTLPIPSRFDSSTEFELSQEWLTRFSDELAEIYQGWLPKKILLRSFLEITKLPYVPFFSFGEKLPVIEQGTVDPTGLGYAYETLSALLANNFESLEKLPDERSEFIRLAARLTKPEVVNTPPQPLTYAKKSRVFLSYAEEDYNHAIALYDELGRNFAIPDWQDPSHRGKDFIQKMEEEIARADIFVIVWSRHYRSSYWCDQERKLALRLEMQRKAQSAQYSLIYVVKISSEDEMPGGFLGGLDIFDLTEPKRTQELATLIGKFNKGQSVRRPPSTFFPTDRSTWLTFQGREVELETVLQGLLNPAGEHFWLVVAGPGMGKTWFIDEIPRRLEKQLDNSLEWTIKKIDLHNQPSDLRSNTSKLLMSFFDKGAVAPIDNSTIRELAREVSRSDKSWLLLLDVGELLADVTVRELRVHIGTIYRMLTEHGSSGLRIACVVASRKQHQQWKPVSPKPRISVLPLTHFKPSIIDSALRAMTKHDNRSFDDNWYRTSANLLHRASEGLPALLIGYMEEMRNTFGYVVHPEDIESRKTFDKVALPYIQEKLLSVQSLISYGGDPNLQGNRRLALELSLLLLSTYRLFTYSHLKHVIDQEPELENNLHTLGWSINDLWQAIRETHLMKPIEYPWREIYSAIRRLLFRYKFTNIEQQVVAHQRAGNYYEDWWQSIPSSKEQSVFLIERLWHQAEQTRLMKPIDGKDNLIQFAQKLLVDDIHPNGNIYIRSEILEYVESRLSNDEEMEETLESIEPSLWGVLLQKVKEAKEGH